MRWFVTGGLPPDQIRVLEANGFRVVQRDAWFLLWERPAPPLARLYYDVDAVAGTAQRLARLRAGYPLRERTRVQVAVRTGGSGLLVLGDPWYPQWRVEVDGHLAELLRVDHALRGVRLPAGSHQVVFTYRDRALEAGLALTTATIIGLAGLWGWRRRRDRSGDRG